MDTSGYLKLTSGSQTLTNTKASRHRLNREKVTYWAGLRIEGALTPFEIKNDEMYKWNTGIANGQLFEKINLAK